MKHLVTFNESNRFLHMKEVLNTIEDMCLDLKDEGGEMIFGFMPSSDLHHPSFDPFFGEASQRELTLKKASLGKMSIYVKFDIQKVQDFHRDESKLEILINTINSVYNYLIGEDLIVNSFWTKEMVASSKIDYGKSHFFQYKTIDSLINSIDWSRKEKLTDIITTVDGIRMKFDDFAFRYLLDVRIVFTTQPLLDESLQISESDLEDVKDIIDDFNSEYADEGQYHIKADLNYLIKMRRAFSGTKSIQGQYVVVISDRTASYDGFQFHESIPLILRLMSKFEIDQIELGILNIHEPGRKFKKFTKQQLEAYLDKNYVLDQVSNISISIDNIIDNFTN